MLEKVEIKNFLTIDHIILELDNELSAIVGESGAGKSLVLKAIDSVFSQKTQSSLIGRFKDESFVKLFFRLNEKQRLFLSLFGIDDDEIVIEKVIKPKKARTYINHEPVGTKVLSHMTDTLLNIVSQNYRFRAFDSENLLDTIDSFIDKDIRESFENFYFEYLDIKNKKENIEEKISVINDKHPEVLLESIEKVDPKKDEYELLLNNLKKIKSASEVKEKSQRMIDELFENDNSVETVLGRMEDSADKIISLGYDASQIKEALSGAMENISAVKSRLYKLLDDEGDVVDVDSIEARLFELEQLQRKFGKKLNEIVEEKDALRELLQKKEELLFELKSIDKELRLKESELKQKADLLSFQRKQAAENLKIAIKTFLSDMLIQNSIVEFQFSQKKMSRGGCDNVEILFSANPDIKADKIDKIASGGERSRFILAMEVARSINNDKLETIILDEIESGISDKTLQEVAKVIKELSKRNQIILITHNSYLSKIAKKIFKIEKEYKNDITKSFVVSNAVQ